MKFNGLTGRVVTPDDTEYRVARLGYNKLINDFPLAIVYCRNAHDVVNAVKWSQKNGVPIRIRSGGHNYEGFSMGTCPSVAISGLVLGGGIGLSVRRFGLTCDSLIEAEMADAGGNLLTANRRENSDLFWARPVGNIAITDGKPKWGEKCEHCVACIQWCPLQAIEYADKTVNRKRYRNPEIKVGELMKK